MFGEIGAWLSSHLSLWPSIGLGVLGLLWGVFTAVVVTDNDDSEGSCAGGMVIGILAMIGCLIGSVVSGSWALWLPYIAGVLAIPGIIGIAKGISAISEWSANEDARARERQKAYAKSPDGVIERCEGIVQAYLDSLPLEADTPKEQAAAQTKLAALRELYTTLARIEKLGSAATFEQNLAAADGIFSDVLLEKECGALVKMLRARSREDVAPVEDVRAAIEALVLSISELPRKAQARLASQVPLEYSTAAADMAAEIGSPALPDLRVDDSRPEKPDAVTRPPRQRQTA